MNKIKLLLFLCLLSVPSFAVQIPIAKERATGRAVPADRVERRKGPFECFECGKELILRRGPILTAHFAHKHDPHSSCGGGPETAQHKLAKQLLADNLDKWRFERKCSECDCRMGLKLFPAKSGYISHIEYSYNRFRADVMVLNQGKEIAALEVYQTHAVDDEKRAFFDERRIPIIEVDAEEVIKAHKNGSFTVLDLGRERCNRCKWEEKERNRRPCLQCKKRHSKELLEEIEAPPGHEYSTAFVCDDCKEECPDCGCSITQNWLKRYSRCYSCNMKRKKWREDVGKALRDENVERLQRLNGRAPAEEYRRDVQSKTKKIQQEREEQRERMRIQREEEQHRERIKRQQIEQQREKERLRQKKEHQKWLKERAREIVDNDRVYLTVPYSEKEQVKRYGARWTGDGGNWYVSARNIRECSRWLKDCRCIVPMVENLLRSKKGPGAPTPNAKKRKRISNDDFRQPPITAFFGPSD